MTLLDKLIEKKDLEIYLRLRIKRLKQEITERLNKYPEKKRSEVIKRTEGRIKELLKLEDALKRNTLKNKCKRMWKYFNYSPPTLE